MNYFYTYVEDEQEVSSLQQIQTEMQRKNAAVCFFDYGSTAQWEQRSVDLEQMLQLIDFVTGTIRKRNYALQLEGIQKALEKKRNGEGSYGRPKMVLPQDFEENIRKIMRKEMKHEDYQKQLGFKRSTYFKMVKELRDGWKAQDEENETATLIQE